MCFLSTCTNLGCAWTLYMYIHLWCEKTQKRNNQVPQGLVSRVLQYLESQELQTPDQCRDQVGPLVTEMQPPRVALDSLQTSGGCIYTNNIWLPCLWMTHQYTHMIKYCILTMQWQLNMWSSAVTCPQILQHIYTTLKTQNTSILPLPYQL